MKILEKYILKENIKPFLASFFVLTFVMLLDKILDLLDLMIDKQLSIGLVSKIFGLTLPYLVVLTVPMAVLLATIIAFGRLATDNELIAFKACGINIYRLMKSVIIAAVFLTAVMVYFNDKVLPETNHKLSKLRTEISQRQPVAFIQPGVFNDLKEYIIYVSEKDDQFMKGILIYKNKSHSLPETITAKKGNLKLANGGNSLKATLFDGEMYTQDKSNYEKLEHKTFKKMIINLPDLGFSQGRSSSNYRGDREMNVKMMSAAIKDKRVSIKEVQKSIEKSYKKIEILEDKKETSKNIRKVKSEKNQINMKKDKIQAIEQRIREFQVEIHKKYAIAVACLVFVLIGAPIGMMSKSSGIGMAISVSSIVFLFYFATLNAGEYLSDNGIVPAFVSMWFANFLFSIIGIYLTIRSMRENELQFILKIKEFFRKFSKKRIK